MSVWLGQHQKLNPTVYSIFSLNISNPISVVVSVITYCYFISRKVAEFYEQIPSMNSSDFLTRVVFSWDTMSRQLSTKKKQLACPWPKNSATPDTKLLYHGFLGIITRKYYLVKYLHDFMKRFCSVSNLWYLLGNLLLNTYSLYLTDI